jgi:hypothetical protein
MARPRAGPSVTASSGSRLSYIPAVAAMTVGEPTALDRLREVTWGLGVMLDADRYGMGGLGGSLGWAGPALGLAEAYITRQMRTHERAEAMDSAVRVLLG